MSADAYAFVWKYAVNSGASGNHLLVLLAMAAHSKNRSSPFVCSVSYAELAEMTGVSERYMKTMIGQMIDSGHLQLISKGKGQLANIYGFGREGVIPSSAQDVIPRSLLNEDSTEVA